MREDGDRGPVFWVKRTGTETTGWVDIASLEVINVKDFGALGDGQSHPLSERYSSLADAQADFAHATSLGDEIDWAAIQAALNHTTGTVFIPAGRYIINTTLTIGGTSHIHIKGQGKDYLHGGGSVLVSDFSSPAILLDIYGFRWQRISDLTMVVKDNADAAPSTFIDIKNLGRKRSHFWQAERVRIVGRDKTDGNTAISLGKGEDEQGDNVSFRDVDIHYVESGIVFHHNQIVGIELSKLHFNTVKYGLVFADDVAAPTGIGGGMCFGSSIQHTSVERGIDETVVFIRAAGGGTCYTFANLTTEWDATLIDASNLAFGGEQIVVNVIGGRSSRRDKTSPIVKVGPGTVVNCTGGLFRTTPGMDEFDLQGDKDHGDAILNLSGSYIGFRGEFGINANQYGFYRIESCFRRITHESGLVGRGLIDRRLAREYVPYEFKTPMALTGHIRFPLHSNNPDGGNKILNRYLPPNTQITRIIANITSTTATSGFFQLRIPHLGPVVNVINAQVAGYRELRLLDSQIKTGDMEVHLEDPNFDLTGGSIAIRRTNDECKKAQGYCIVEYAYLSAGVDFDITP